MKKTALALAACAALTLAGCGDDAPKALSKADFTTQANAICASMEKKMDAAGKSAMAQKANPAKMMKTLADTAMPILDEAVTKLRALEPPADIKDDVTAMLDAVDAESAAIKKDPMKLASDDVFKDANAKATALGLDKCAS